MELQLPTKYQGGCHCGSVRYEAIIDNYTADECNCSICLKKGFLHHIVDSDKFTLTKGQNTDNNNNDDDNDKTSIITTYRFNTGVAQHKFCKYCGIHSFYIPRSHPDKIDINIRCLDEADNDTSFLSKFAIVPFNGKHWETNVHKLNPTNVITTTTTTTS